MEREIKNRAEWGKSIQEVKSRFGLFCHSIIIIIMIIITTTTTVMIIIIIIMIIPISGRQRRVNSFEEKY